MAGLTMSTVYPMQSDKISGHTPGGYPIGDRAISSQDLADIDKEIYSDGIISTAEGSGAYYQVVAGSGMNVTVNAGKCYIRGRKASTPTNTQLTVDQPDALLDRKDRVVLRLDLTNEVRDVVITVKKGGANPPALTRTSSVWELGLADINIRKGTASILQSDITDLRYNSNICGRAYNELLKVDTTGIFDQMRTIIDEMRMMYTGLETQSFALFNNNFDDWSVKRGCDKTTIFNKDGSITETITVVAIPLDMARKTTVFNGDGSILETIRFYSSKTQEGNHEIITTNIEMSRRTIFNANGSIKEEIR